MFQEILVVTFQVAFIHQVMYSGQRPLLLVAKGHQWAAILPDGMCVNSENKVYKSGNNVYTVKCN